MFNSCFNRFGGVTVSVFAMSVVDRGFECLSYNWYVLPLL